MFRSSDTQKAWGSAALLLIKKTRELFIVDAANTTSGISESSVTLLSHHPEVEHDVSHMLEVADPLYHIFAQQCQVVSTIKWLQIESMEQIKGREMLFQKLDFYNRRYP